MFRILGKCHGHTIKKNIQLATYIDIQRVFSDYSQRCIPDKRRVIDKIQEPPHSNS